MIFEDRAKRMWFGTRENGLYIYDPLKESVVHKYHELNNSKRTSIDKNNSLFMISKLCLNTKLQKRWILNEVPFV